MVCIPFFYFLLLFIFYFIKSKKRFDIACYIIIIYASSSLGSILIDYFGLYEHNHNISFESVFVYCFLITLNVMPFILYSNNRIKNIKPVENEKFLKYMSFIMFSYFVFSFFMSFNELKNIITGDIGELRAAHYTENLSSGWLSKIPYIFRIPCIILNLISGAPWILLFLGFYSILIQKMPNIYGIFFITSSLLGVVGNLLEAGRSDMVYWTFSFFACYIFFYDYIKNRKIKIFNYFILFVSIIILVLIVIFTTQRFEERDYGSIGGTEGGFLTYFGQAFLNFSYFYDTFTCPTPSLEVIFPLTYNIIGISEGGIVAIQQQLSLKTNVFTGVFYTYIGQIMVTSNIIITIIYCLLYSFCSIKFCKKNIKYSSLKYNYMFFMLSSIMFLGLFSHYYGYMNKTASILIWYFFISKFLNKQKNGQYCKNLI